MSVALWDNPFLYPVKRSLRGLVLKVMKEIIEGNRLH